MNRRIAQFFALLLLVTSVAHAENWPQWRGPTLNGVSGEKNLPSEALRLGRGLPPLFLHIKTGFLFLLANIVSVDVLSWSASRVGHRQ